MNVVVVGAGVGGLCAAIELAHAGHRVQVLEQGDAPGGKCARVARGDYRWDAGPSLLTLPRVFADLFAATGRPLDDELELLRVEPVTRYEFADGSSVELSADLPRALDALEAWSPGAGADWMRFLGTCAGMWRASEAFLAGPAALAAATRSRRRATAGPKGRRAGATVVDAGAARACARARPSAADDHRALRDVRGRGSRGGRPPRWPSPATSSMRSAPGIRVVASTSWCARSCDGSRRSAESCASDSPVERIVVRAGRACGVETPAGVREADAVVAAVDEALVRRRLLPDARRAASASARCPGSRCCSACAAAASACRIT